MFINPMWDNEAQRIGKQRCTPLGYALHGVSDLIGFAGLLLLLGTGAYLAYRGFVGTWRWGLLWFLTIPFGLGILGAVLHQISWYLAHRKGFHYDYDTREASWVEDGQRRTFRYE